MMRTVQLLIVLLLASVCSFGQMQVTEPDKSPLDISYSPHNYPILKFQTKNMEGKLNARVIYSRPQVKDRKIFGGELKYNELWRIGANESTELELFKNAVVGGKKIAKGRYTLFCIPYENKWTLIFNKDTDSWGGFNYKPEMDVLRTDVPVVKNASPVEYLTMYFDTPNNLVIMWAEAKVNLPLQYVTK